MRVGVGLPNVIPGTTPELLAEWAALVEAGPFDSVGSLHRAAWDVIDPLEALRAAAGATTRLGLVTMVAVAPLYDTGWLAEEAAAIDRLSGGRFVLGLSVGARLEDYEAAGVDPRGRGRRLDDQLVDLRNLWEEAGARVPPVLVGGTADIAFARMARWSDGYVHGGGPPRAFATAILKARAAWTEFARPASPQIWGQSYFALGDESTLERGRAYMREYYAFTGPFVERIVEDLLTTPQQVAARVRGYAEAGCEHLVFVPTSADPAQVDLLAEVLAA